jgi:hypothetical protein
MVCEKSYNKTLVKPVKYLWLHIAFPELLERPFCGKITRLLVNTKTMSKNKNTTEHQLLDAMHREQETTKMNREPMNFTPKVHYTAREMALYDKAIFTWIAPEYIQHQKGRVWYLVAAIIAGAIILLDLFTNNFTMAFAVMVFAGVYYYIHTHHPPKEIKITISKMGIKVGNMIFPFNNIQAFWIMYQPPHITTLSLRVKEHFFSDVIIQLNHEDPAPIREYLCGQIPEWEGKAERLGDVVLRLLKL